MVIAEVGEAAEGDVDVVATTPQEKIATNIKLCILVFAHNSLPVTITVQSTPDNIDPVTLILLITLTLFPVHHTFCMLGGTFANLII